MIILPLNANCDGLNEELWSGFVLRIASWYLVATLIYGLRMFIPALSQFKWLGYIGYACMAIGLVHGVIYLAKSHKEKEQYENNLLK